jgi:hypothetical protein
MEAGRWWSAAGDREAKGIAIYAALSNSLSSGACGGLLLVCSGLASLLMCRAFAFYSYLPAAAVLPGGSLFPLPRWDAAVRWPVCCARVSWAGSA